MKRSLLILGFLILTMGLRIDAQTLKNIHRHNQPVLRIPTHLIDKVETADVNGERVLKVIQLNGYVSQIPLSQIDSITHSEGQAVDPSQLGNLRTASVMGVVTGPTGAPEMNAIVRSPYGGEETRTDPNGVFFLNNILVYDKLGYITITKPGFHQGSRSFLPLETGSNRVNVQLLPMTLSGSFSASTGGTVTSGLLQLSFPANAIQLNGQPYTGTVNVYAQALDPTSTAMFDQMPGELIGGMNDSLRLLRSFGMASIELRDANMNELQIADQESATLTFSIPSALQSDAPQNIDWWSFDESIGYWKHEGEATKQGTQYVGQANHFSWWNCDVPGTYNEFEGIINTTSTSPLSEGIVQLVSPTQGTAIIYTNAEGEFIGRVPRNQTLTLNVYLFCSTTNNLALALSEPVVSGLDSIIGNYTANLSGIFYPITGTVVNCQGQPVATGYVKMGNTIFNTSQGNFTIQTCALGDYAIRGYDTSIPDSIKASSWDTVQVDNSGAVANDIQACSTIFGSVTDIESNIYGTVLIGSQWWMTENLHTSTYANGEIIPNVTNNTSWSQLNTEAWCNFNNNTANDAIYGKLYNYYVVTDPRNVCPTGWHVPSDEEWNILIGYLDPSFDSDTLGTQSQTAGGKMKSTGTQLWTSPNTDATNESGFSGLPAGVRANNGSFNAIGISGWWWSSTENYTTSAWGRYLSFNVGSADRTGFPITAGSSVRCIKD